MIFNLVKAAKQLFIDRNNTGVEADNVEDAIKALNKKTTYRGYKNFSTDTFTGNIAIYNVGFVKLLYVNNIKLVNTLEPSTTVVLANIDDENYRPALSSISHSFPVVASGGLTGRVQIATNGDIRLTNLSSNTFRTDSPIHLNAVFI